MSDIRHMVDCLPLYRSARRLELIAFWSSKSTPWHWTRDMKDASRSCVIFISLSFT